MVKKFPRGYVSIFNAKATLTEGKYPSHSQSGNVNKPVAQVENSITMPTTHARTHTTARSQEFMEENGLERVIHPSYLPDLALSDFYLFSHVKHCLRGQSSEMADELFLSIDAVLRGLEKYTLLAAFLDWVQRLRQSIEANGDYFEGA
jgi:exoribonuclease R